MDTCFKHFGVRYDLIILAVFGVLCCRYVPLLFVLPGLAVFLAVVLLSTGGIESTWC